MTLGIETGAPIRRTEGRIGWGINTPWTREMNPRTGRKQFELRGDMLKGRMGGSFADPEEWRRSIDWKNWMPTRSVARPLLLFQAGLWGYSGGEGVYYEDKRRREFGAEPGSGYDPRDFFNSQLPRGSDQSYEFGFPVLSRGFPFIKDIPYISKIPIPRFGEFFAGPRRKYAEDWNAQQQAIADVRPFHTFERKNEEFTHTGRSGFTGPSRWHPFQFSKAAAIEPKRWGSDWFGMLDGLGESNVSRFCYV